MLKCECTITEIHVVQMTEIGKFCKLSIEIQYSNDNIVSIFCYVAIAILFIWIL